MNQTGPEAELSPLTWDRNDSNVTLLTKKANMFLLFKIALKGTEKPFML